MAFDYLTVNGDLRLKEIWNKTSGNMLHSKFNYSYDAAGQMQSWRREGLGGSEATEYTFAHDAAGQLLGAVLKGVTSGTVQKAFTYGYDAAGNRSVEQDGTTLTQDAHNTLNQLTGRAGGTSLPIRGVTDEPVASVAVNGVPAKLEGGTKFEGKATVAAGANTVTVEATDYGAPPNVRTKQYQITVVAGATKVLSYDVNGNMLSDGTRNYEWDAADRLIAVEQGVQRTEFTYDGMSRRSKVVEKTNGAITSSKRLVWEGMGIVEERETTGNTLNKRYFGNGVQLVGGANAGNYFYTRDHLGSIREMVDASGVVKARYDYDPYGKQTKLAGTMDADFGFTGHYTHEGTGLVLAPFRAYDAGLGRWISRDPIEEEGGINLYGYVGNGPLQWIDLLGLQLVLGAPATPDMRKQFAELTDMNSEDVCAYNKGMDEVTDAWLDTAIKIMASAVRLYNPVTAMRSKALTEFSKETGLPVKDVYDMVKAGTLKDYVKKKAIGAVKKACTDAAIKAAKDLKNPKPDPKPKDLGPSKLGPVPKL